CERLIEAVQVLECRRLDHEHLLGGPRLPRPGGECCLAVGDEARVAVLATDGDIALRQAERHIELVWMGGRRLAQRREPLERRACGHALEHGGIAGGEVGSGGREWRGGREQKRGERALPCARSLLTRRPHIAGTTAAKAVSLSSSGK